MNRCALARLAMLSSPADAQAPARRSFVLAGLAVLAAPAASLLPSPALAQTEGHRKFPALALRGELTLLDASEAQLGNQVLRLAPGARIRSAQGMLQMSSALVGQKLLVHYTKEATTGLLQDIWVLNDIERANRIWPSSEAQAKAWVFDPAAQTWTRP